MAGSSTLTDEALVRALEPLTFTKLLAQIINIKASSAPPAKKRRTDNNRQAFSGAASTSDADVVVTAVVDADEAAAAKKEAAEARGDFVDIAKIEELEMRSREATEKACNYLRWCYAACADVLDGRFLWAVNVEQLTEILRYIAPAFVKPDDVAHILDLTDSLTPHAEVPARVVRDLLRSPAAATPAVVVKEENDNNKKGKGKHVAQVANEAEAARPYSASLCPASYDDSVGDMSASSRGALCALRIAAYHHHKLFTEDVAPLDVEGDKAREFLKGCVVTQSTLAKWLGEPFFENAVKGLFVRIKHSTPTGEKYLVYTIERAVNLPTGEGTRYIRVRCGDKSMEKAVRIDQISGDSPRTSEWVEYKNTAARTGVALPSKSEAKKLIAQIEHAMVECAKVKRGG